MALWGNRDQENNKPKYLSSADKAKTYGVNWDETMWNPGQITDIAIVQGGTNYTEQPNVTIQSTGEGANAAATADIFAGVVTAITVTNNGNGGYNQVPQVYIDVPRRTIATTAVNTTADTITYNNHALENGDAVIYRAVVPDAFIAGLGNGTTYYVNTVDVNVFKLYDTKAHSEAGGATGLKNLTSTGNSAQYFDLVDPAGTTATAKAVLGTGSDALNGASGYSEWVQGEQHITHAGWVKKTVGTGGRAGRVQYETLVAMGSMIGDASGDTAFPSGD